MQIFEAEHSFLTLEVLDRNFRELAKSHSDIALDVVCKYLFDEEIRYKFHVLVYSGIFEDFTGDQVSRKIDQAKQDRVEVAKMIARHVSSPSMQDGAVEMPKITEWILKTFEDEDEVFRAFLRGRHSFKITKAIEYEDLAKINRTYASYADHPFKRVREWANWEASNAESEAKWNEKHTDIVKRR